MGELGRPNSWYLVNAITVNVDNGFFHETTENINRAIGSELQAWSHGVTQHDCSQAHTCLRMEKAALEVRRFLV